MTNAEKFKEDFGFELKNIGRYEDGYYCIDSDADIECKTCPLYEKRCSHVAFINWWNSEYQGEPTIPLSAIEDIKYDVEKYFVDNIWAKKDDCSEETKHFKAVLEIIGKAIKECTHE